MRLNVTQVLYRPVGIQIIIITEGYSVFLAIRGVYIYIGPVVADEILSCGKEIE